MAEMSATTKNESPLIPAFWRDFLIKKAPWRDQNFVPDTPAANNPLHSFPISYKTKAKNKSDNHHQYPPLLKGKACAANGLNA